MKKKVSPLYWVAVVIFLVLTVGPFVWAFSISVTPEYEMFKNTMNMFPSEITWDNYLTLFDSISQQHIRLFRGLENSLKAVACTLVIGIPVAAVTAYTLSRMEFGGEEGHQERDLDYYGHSGVCDYHSSIQDVLGYGTAQQHFLAEHGICQLLSAYEHLADEQLLFDDTQGIRRSRPCGRLRTAKDIFPDHTSGVLSYHMCQYAHYVPERLESVSDSPDPGVEY